MPLLSLLLFGFWALLSIRLICFRSTLGTRTLLTYLVLGAAMGPVAVSVAEKFFNEYSWTGGAGYFILINAAKQLMLLIPVLWLLTRPAWRNSSSLTDSFLLAFAIGFGYELSAAIITSMPRQTVEGFSFLPPGIYSGSAANVAGYGWWIGTIALMFAASRRLLPKDWIAYISGGVVLLLCAVDQTLVAVYPADVPKFWDVLTFHRSAAPYICLLLLVLCVVLESLRTKRAAGQPSLVSEYQALLTHYIAFRFHEARQLAAQSRIGRQLDIVRTELQLHPNDPELTALTSNLEGQSQIAKQPAAAATAFNFKDLLRRRAVYLGFAVLAFLLIIVFAAPFMQPFGGGIWQWFLFADKWAPFQFNIVSTALLAWMMWSYFTSPPALYQGVRTDESARFYCERAIVQTGLAIFLIACIYEIPVAPPAYSYYLPSPVEFISFASPFTVGAGLATNAMSDAGQTSRWITVLLLILCAATGMTARRWELWRSAPQPVRLRTSVQHLLSTLRAGIVAWLALVLFTYVQILAHIWFSKSIVHNWDPARHTVLGLDIRNWNSALGLISALVTLPAVLAFIWFARWVSRHVQDFLLPEPQAVATPQGAKTAGTAGGS